MLDAFKFLKGATSRTPKITMPAPSELHLWDAATGKPVHPPVKENGVVSAAGSLAGDLRFKARRGRCRTVTLSARATPTKPIVPNVKAPIR